MSILRLTSLAAAVHAFVELTAEVDRGVRFYNIQIADRIVGVMGIQDMNDFP